MEEEKKSLFWADQLAQQTIARAKKEGRTPNIKCQQTPSGGKHIGNLNDVLRAYFVYKSIIEKGERCDFVHGSDDRDPLKDIPAKLMDLDGKWHSSGEFQSIRDYLGHPLCHVPDPFGCCESWSRHFTKIWMEGIEGLGVHPTLYYNDELYKAGKFDKYIQKVFEKKEEASKIVQEFQGSKQEGYIPFDAICPKCGMLTNVNGFDLEKKTVSFVCGGKAIKEKKTQGCGFEGEAPWSQGKLQWRFEWPALWCIWHTTHEPFGKDHAEGSWKSGVEIMKRVFEAEPPIPFVYEFFLVNGKKMSASKGNVYVVQDMLKIMEREVFLFFYAKRPEKQRDLELGEIFRLVDEFDMAEKIYFGEAEDRTDNREENTKRMYEMSVVKVQKECPRRINYAFASSLAQVYEIDECMKKLKELGHVSGSPLDEKLARERLELAGVWAGNYAPPEMRIKVNNKEEAGRIREKMDEGMKELLKEFALILDEEEKVLYEKMKGNCKEKGVEMAKFFESAYTVLLSKNKGPRLIPFAKALGKERMMELMGA